MKARIIKKLSKKISELLPDEYKDKWIDKHDKFLCESYDQGSRVKNCFYIGGELDLWGEGTDSYTVLEDFKDNFSTYQGYWGFYGEGHKFEGMPKHAPYRLTGQKLIALAKITSNGEIK
tara:strand:+ start:412 stop:768 length:357 start_codon:yes stop_codon:yes gene_type:complete